MTKLEELTALLVNEINDFDKGVETLEKISKQINATKIKMDLTEYKAIIDEHQQEMESHLNTLKSFENRFDIKIKQAKIYPTWAVVVFIITVLLGLGAVIFVLK